MTRDYSVTLLVDNLETSARLELFLEDHLETALSARDQDDPADLCILEIGEDFERDFERALLLMHSGKAGEVFLTSRLQKPELFIRAMRGMGAARTSALFSTAPLAGFILSMLSRMPP